MDLIASTQHDRFAAEDYRGLRSVDMRTCRDGVRWHLIERRAFEYDFSSLRSQLLAAGALDMEVIWDLCHYGWPDGLNVYSPEFVDRFARFSRAVARLISQETDATPFFSPVNEISFFSWAGGEKAILPPFTTGRGHELKCQLVRASIAAIEAIRDELPQARFVQIDPLIHIVTDERMSAATKAEAAAYCRSQFQAWDMLAGHVHPELGGNPKYLDILGGNYYIHNQWVFGGKFIERTDPRYRPLHDMLHELWSRYRKPVFIAETGIEGDLRPEWLRFVTDEVVLAMRRNVPVQGICLYPILDHPGWVDDRHCPNGLWDYCNESGERCIYIPLAEELRLQKARLAEIRATRLVDSTRRRFSPEVPFDFAEEKV